MDNLTHGLLAASIGMLRRRERGPETDFPTEPPTQTDRAVVWAAFIAGEMPDLDVFLGSEVLDEYIYHRGFSHSLVVAPVIAAVATGLVKLVWRQARASTVYVWSLFSVLAAHLINDWMTGWGTRLLWPFSEFRLGLDWIPIIDLLYTVPLLAAVIVAVRRPSLRRRVIPAVLIYLLVYTVGYRGISHTLVESRVREAYAGRPVQQVRVAPDLFNPIRWQFTVDLGDRFEQGSALAWTDPKVITVTEKPAEDDVVRAVRGAPELKPFFDQFAYVQIEYRRVGNGYEVTLGDVRYRFAGRGMGLRVLLSPDLQVNQIMNFR